MKFAWFGLAVVLASLLVWGGCGLTKQAYLTLEKWGDSAPGPTASLVQSLGHKAGKILDGGQAAMDTVNAPCAGDQPCRGTLGSLNKTIIKVGDAVASTQYEEKTKVVPATLDAMGALKSAAGDLGGTARAATETLDQVNDKNHGVGATLANVNDGIIDFKTYVKSEAVQQTVDDFMSTNHHFSNMSASADLMLVDAQWKEHQLIHPDKTKLTFTIGLEAGLLWSKKYVLPQINIF